MKRPSGLGRGLGALIEESNRPRATDGDHSSRSIREVEIGRIRPNPNQPRKKFDDQSLADLAHSIAERGVLQPILLREVGDGYQIVAGERRWRAAQRALLHQIPAIIGRFDDSAIAEVALIENVQREDLNPVEEAEAYRLLIVAHGHKQDEVGRLVGKSRSHIANLLRLLDLPAEVREMLMRGDITMGHARAVAAAPDPSALASQIVAEGLSVRQAEALVRAARPSAAASVDRPPRPVDADLAALQRQLGDLLGLRIKLAHGAQGGTVTLHYSSLDQLDMICQRLSGEPI